MEEKLVIKSFFRDFYNLQEKYLCMDKLTDDQWKNLIYESNEIIEKYAVHGNNIKKFAMGCLMEMICYKERKEHKWE